MTFFITSAGSGDGANLGGLEGADAICMKLAEAAGAGDKTWHAYLSAEGVNAKDRIGAGPVAELRGRRDRHRRRQPPQRRQQYHQGDRLTETGAVVNGRGDDPNQHDILTGTNADGTLAAGQTCNDWTRTARAPRCSATSTAWARTPLRPATSWNAAHPSRGCGQEALVGTGGNGYLYCFAVIEP